MSHHRSVLVTGGTGSFGRRYTQLALESGVERVAIFSRDETKQGEMRAEMKNDPRLRWMLGDVCDTERLERAMRGVDLVVHAAAMKQVPACELNPGACIRTNVVGTQSVVDAVLRAGVRSAVFLSTDKASAPNTHYGACKLAAERLWTQANVYAAGTSTRFSATRYGNVLGSRGSVVELWRKQREQKLVTITDARMTRFWMTLDQAVQLVMLASVKMQGGEVFVPAIRAAAMSVLADAVVPGCAFDVIGIRRGEKMHEQLVSEDEARYTFDHGTHYRIEPDRSWTDTQVSVAADRKPVPEGWSMRSDNVEQMTADQLRRLAGEW